MSLTRPRTMRGVMELLPLDQIAFQNMLATIREGYERFGFLPVETPVMEYREILLTKEGGETERQVYFAQSTGSIEQGKEPQLALRFDLTVPLARYVAEHERQLTFPFRRYQMQRVYRGEQAQRGRYREFYQCDIDVIGKDSLPLAYDAEIPAAIHTIFSKLNVGPFTIHINNRKIMTGFFAAQGVSPEQQPLVLREVDKLDKRGAGYVKDTLTGENFGLSEAVVDAILNFIAMEADTAEGTITALRELKIEDETYQTGLAELDEVITALGHSGVPEQNYRINLSIARGLDYYTGTVYETTLDDHPEVGSVCSGGRYENLASHYTKSKLPGVGISIGATRLFYQLQAAGLIATGKSTVQAYVTRMDDSLAAEYLKLAAELRSQGVPTEVNYSGGKFGKQMKACDRAGIRFAIIMGEDEMNAGKVTVKDLVASEQFETKRSELATAIKERLS